MIDASAATDARVTSPFFGDDGAPIADVLAFCRMTNPASDVRDMSRGVQLVRVGVRVCNLEVTPDSPTYGTVLAVVRSWSAFDSGTRLDHRDRLTVGFEITPKLIRVSWSPYVELETILGGPARLLAGFDVSRVLGKPPTALRDAISSPFTIGPLCDLNACGANGPALPGGSAVTIEVLRNGVMVTLSTTRELLPRVHELITASLGPGQQDGPDTVHVHTKDGVRYSVRDSDAGPVSIIIEKL